VGSGVPPERDSVACADPGVETPGYCQGSLRDPADAIPADELLGGKLLIDDFLLLIERHFEPALDGVDFFRPFGAGGSVADFPTACAVGCVLSPLRGFLSPRR